MANEKRLTLLIFSLFLSANNLCAQGQILEKKVLSNPVPDCFDIRSTDLFIDSNNNTFVRINGFLYVNNNWIKMDKYGSLLNGFLKDGRFYMAFEKDGNIDIYNIKKDFELTSRIKIIDRPNILWRDTKFQRIFAVPGKDNLYFLQGWCWKFPTNPFEFLFCLTSGGHGITYVKPFLAEVRDDKMLRYLKLRYGGKLDESFYVQEATEGENSINLLGFRKLVEPAFGPNRYAPWPTILYYADYNLKKKKVTGNHTVYEDIVRYDKNTDSRLDFGPLSMDNFGDDVFIAFSWYAEGRMNNRERFEISYFKSNIYYLQCSNDRFGDIEKIAEGFSPIVRADFLGNVHIIWVDRDGNFFHKIRKDGRWSDAEVILSGIDICSSISVVEGRFPQNLIRITI